MLPGILVARTGSETAMQAVIDASGLPFATMFMAKSVLDEQHPGYVGMYDGTLMSSPVRDFVEGCDQVLAVGIVDERLQYRRLHGAAGSSPNHQHFVTTGHR